MCFWPPLWRHFLDFFDQKSTFSVPGAHFGRAFSRKNACRDRRGFRKREKWQFRVKKLRKGPVRMAFFDFFAGPEAAKSWFCVGFYCVSWKSPFLRSLKKVKKNNTVKLFGSEFDLILEVILVTFSRKKWCKIRHGFRKGKKSTPGAKKSTFGDAGRRKTSIWAYYSWYFVKITFWVPRSVF